MNEIATIEDLRRSLSYDPETGELTWLCGRRSGKRAGSDYGSYRVLKMNGERAPEHRAIWALHHGFWPDVMVDHADGDKKNNKIENLRLATASQNSSNRKRPSTNTSGHKGVVWMPKVSKWRAQIWSRGKHYFLGDFEAKEQACAAYRNASDRLHGEFGRLA